MILDIRQIKQELVVFLRNQDILTTSQRGVSTVNATGTLNAEDTITIERTNVKNIRSITVDGAIKSFGKDYTVDYNHSDGCVITFTSDQTGDYVVSYDYGSDKIYPDFPRDDLSIDSYPRIAVDIMSITTDAFGIGGNEFISDLTFTVVVYSNNADKIDSYIQSIKDAMIANAKLFYYISFVKPILIGPLINSPDRSNEIMQRNADFQGLFQVN